VFIAHKRNGLKRAGGFLARGHEAFLGFEEPGSEALGNCCGG
jgi:hypothetical protein